MKIWALKSDVQISETLKKNCNLKTSKMGKTLFYSIVYTLKETLFQEQRKQTEKVKTTRLPPVKRFFIAI
jgi:hypothetical protein